MLLIASLQIQDKVFDNLNSNPKSALKNRLPCSAFLWLHKAACDSALCLCLVALFNSSDHQNRNQYIVHCLHGLRKTIPHRALTLASPLLSQLQGWPGWQNINRRVFALRFSQNWVNHQNWKKIIKNPCFLLVFWIWADLDQKTTKW